MAGMNEAKRDEGFSRPNSVPSSSSVGRVASHNNGDYSIQICSIPSSNPPHQHTSSFAASSNKDPSFLKDTLYRAASEDKWEEAKDIFVKYPDMVRTPLTGNGDTALHVAVNSDSLAFAEELVKLLHMTSQDLEIPNSEGNTAFYIAAISGYSDLIAIMIKKNKKLPLISGQGEMLPIHLAASSGHAKIVRHLSSHDLLGQMACKDIARLFLLSIRSDIYDVANKIYDKYIDRDWLVSARDDRHLTALHILAQKPYDYDSSILFRRLWDDDVSRLEYSTMLELITEPSVVLFDAIESGKDDEAIHILSKNPRLLTLQDSCGRNVLHCAAQHRQEKVLFHLLGLGRVKHMMRAVDLDGNNVLHSAAKYQSKEAWSRFSTTLQRELAWFKKLATEVFSRELMTMKNKEGKTPIEMFYASRIALSKQDRETAKGMANSGMVVAALIATVAFAAALTVPGDKTSTWFPYFILSNTIALFASCASIISFLSIFTSPLFNSPLINQLVISLTPINIGLLLLIFAVGAMIFSFCAASFLIFDHVFKWVARVVVLLGVLPIFMFPILGIDNLELMVSRMKRKLISSK